VQQIVRARPKRSRRDLHLGIQRMVSVAIMKLLVLDRLSRISCRYKKFNKYDKMGLPEQPSKDRNKRVKVSKCHNVKKRQNS
jgi:hypothetical protein